MSIGAIDSGFNMFKPDVYIKNTPENKFEETLKALSTENMDDKALRKACMDFEAIFLRMMYKEMRNSIPKSDLVKKSSATEVYEDMMDEKLVDEIVRAKGIGLGEMLYKAIQRQNGVGKNSGGD